MFDIGWPEMLVIAVVMIVVVGPKDLPKMLRTVGRMASKLTSVAGDFRRQFDQALKEAELDDLKNSVDQIRSLDPRNIIRKELDPITRVGQDVKSGLDAMMAKPVAKPAAPAAPASAEPASPVVHEAEPVKAAAVAMPGEGRKKRATARPAASKGKKA
ncbi:MAG: Sec-independent protein translocase protein TatB [Rhizobiaceae bacterium]